MSAENLDLFAGAQPAPPASPPETPVHTPEAERPSVDNRPSVDKRPSVDNNGAGESRADTVVDFDEADRSEGLREPEPTVWTVSQVNRAVRRQLEQRLPQIWVTGEVANFTQQRSGHCYFTLKDEAAQLRCVLFRREAERLPAMPEEGTSVTLFGGLTLYEARGSYQMVVQKLQLSDVEGLWKLAFERTRKKLEQEGLLDPSRKRPLPRFPRRIGVVTSPTGAALRDIISVTRRRAPWLELVLRGTRVQGEGVGLEIADALRVLAERGGVEMIILARGGGSIEDLWGFNEEAVARAIAACPVPVVSGVGHEVDVTISDLVADVRAATPSAAAEAAAPDREAVLHLFVNTRRRLARGLSDQVARRRWRIERAQEGLLRSGRGVAAGRRRALEVLESRIEARIQRRITDAKGVLGRLTEGLEARSPLSTLARGYAVPLDGAKVLRNLDAFHPGQHFRLRVVDGSVPCVVDGAPTPAAEGP